MIGFKFEKPLQEDVIRWTTEVKVTKENGDQVFDKNGNPLIEFIEHEKLNDAPNTLSKYAECAQWCNENNAYIEDKGDYYEVVAIPEPTEAELVEQALVQAKVVRADAVEKIVVEVDGMLFDGDEVSQGRMARSAVAMTDEETITWVLHDNTIAQVTKAQLLQALRLAGEEQTRLWTMPYEG